MSSHGKTAEDYADDYTKPELRERLKEEIKEGDKGGKPGQWSARKSQLLTHEYEEHGGGYKGDKTDQQKSLEQWTDEDWQTKEGSADADSPEGMHRYLPKKAWDEMTEKEKEATDQKKLKASRRGQQFVPNTDAAKRAKDEAELKGMTVDELNDLAADYQIEGRSKLKKDELVDAVLKAQHASGGSASGGDDKTKAELYDEAKEKDIPGRSTMDKSELAEAVEQAD